MSNNELVVPVNPPEKKIAQSGKAHGKTLTCLRQKDIFERLS